MSLKKHQIIPFLLATVLLLGCGHHRYDGELALVDSLQKLDSAYLPDTLLQPIVRYYDRWGTRNEQARAHYLLGRTYHIEGLLPQALDAYQTAAERADTTARDRDYSLLMKVYACQSIVFQYQRLSEEALQSLAQEEYYARLVNDSLTITVCNLYRMLAFYDINQHDSLEIYGKKTYEGYCRMGLHSQAVLSQFTLLHSYLERKEFESAKLILDEIDHTGDYFNEKGDVLYESSTYYYCKGLYYLGVNQLDSAEYYFLKESEYSDDYNNQIGASRGLSLVYDQKGDYRKSTAYAQLAYSLNDSAYNLSIAENLQQMQAAYDYRHHQRIAEQKEMESERYRGLLLFSFTLLIFGILFFMSYLRLQRKKREKEKQMLVTQYQQNLLRMEAKQAVLRSLPINQENDNKELIIRLKQSIKDLEGKLSSAERNLALFPREESKINRKLLNLEAYQKFRNFTLFHKGSPMEADWLELFGGIDDLLPTFFGTINQKGKLDIKSVKVCVLVRLFFQPKEIAELLHCSQANVSLLRRRLLKKVFEMEGKPEIFDKKIQEII